MNGLTLMAVVIVCLWLGYHFYGRWLEKTWGIDPNAKTPAALRNDGKDYQPASRLSVFAHQFTSITGAGPVTGPIIAAMFGWLPALLWIIIGGIFFGAVQDFTALYASVKNGGKSMGMIIEQYVGRFGRQLFLAFCWLFTLLVIAAFADMIAATFNGFTKTGEQNMPNAAAASISMIYIVGAVIFGLFQKYVKPSSGLQLAVGIAMMIAMLAMAAMAFLHGDVNLSIFCTACAGACLGFLWFNCYPASIFMGDTGSLALGAAFACTSIMTNTEVVSLIIGSPVLSAFCPGLYS